MSYIFLTKHNNEGPTFYFAIEPGKIETLKLSNTYDRYGQKVSNEIAGDYSISNGSSNAKADLEAAIEEKFGVTSVVTSDGEVSSFNGIEADDFESYVEDENGVVDSEDEHNKTVDLFIAMTAFASEWRDENETFTDCNGFTYWDGHNWKTVVTDNSVYDDAVTHCVVDDEALIVALNKAIEEKEFAASEFGKRIYNGNGFVVIDSAIQGTWAQYELIAEDEYQELQSDSSSRYNS